MELWTNTPVTHAGKNPRTQTGMMERFSTNAHAEILTAGWTNINMVCNEIDVGFRQQKLVSAEVAENLSLGN